MINMSKEENINKFKRASSLILMSAVCATSVFSVGAFSRQVNVNADDRTISAITVTGDTFEILDRVGVKISEGDSVYRKDEIDGSLKLDVKRAFDVSVSKGDKTVNLKKSQGTVRDAIESSGIELGETDICNFPEDKALEPGMNIIISKTVGIKLAVDGEVKDLKVPSGTVMDTLKYLNIEIFGDDIVNVDIHSDIYEGMEIKVGRVSYREVVLSEEIPFNTVVKKTHLLDDAKREVSSGGKKGEKEITVKETLVDGEVVKSEEISSKVVIEPVDEVILEGTRKPESECKAKSEPSACDPEIQVKGSRVVSGSATAYTAPKGARTSTGAVPVQGITVAVNPKVIPYGKKLVIKSNNGAVLWRGVSQDTGGALRSGSAVVDIYMNSKADCVKFGRKKVNVYFD